MNFKFRMDDFSYVHNAFNTFFLDRSPYIFIKNSSANLKIEELKNIKDPVYIKANLFQSRLLDFFYNSDPNNLECDAYQNEENNCTSDQTIHFFLMKNKFMGLVISVEDFDLFDSDNHNIRFFDNIYDTKGDIPTNNNFLVNMRRKETNKDFILKRGCTFEDNEEYNEFYFNENSIKKLFFPANLSKCNALNNALQEDKMFSYNAKSMQAVAYFLNPVLRLFFAYTIRYSRTYEYRIK